jgi:hypothetical protein
MSLVHRFRGGFLARKKLLNIKFQEVILFLMKPYGVGRTEKKRGRGRPEDSKKAKHLKVVYYHAGISQEQYHKLKGVKKGTRARLIRNALDQYLTLIDRGKVLQICSECFEVFLEDGNDHRLLWERRAPCPKCHLSLRAGL